jgi:hypothetical protein
VQPVFRGPAENIFFPGREGGGEGGGAACVENGITERHLLRQYAARRLRSQGNFGHGHQEAQPGGGWNFKCAQLPPVAAADDHPPINRRRHIIRMPFHLGGQLQNLLAA